MKIPRVPRYEYTEGAACFIFAGIILMVIVIAWACCSGGTK